MLCDASYVDKLAARYYLYAFFQGVFGKEPSREFFDTCDAPLLRESGDLFCGSEEKDGKMFASLAIALSEGKGDGDIACLTGEYMRLFVGSGAPAAMPWESMHLSREPRLFGDVTGSVRKDYKVAGMVPERYPHVADDHIALELDFLRVLARRALEGALGEGETSGWAEACGALATSRDFLANHLARWTGDFAAKTVGACGGVASFYSCCAHALDVFVVCDGRFLDGLAA